MIRWPEIFLVSSCKPNAQEAFAVVAQPWFVQQHSQCGSHSIKVHVLFWHKPLPNGMSQSIQHAILQTVHDETWHVM